MQRDGPPRPSVCQMTGRIKCKDEKKKKKESGFLDIIVCKCHNDSSHITKRYFAANGDRLNSQITKLLHDFHFTNTFHDQNLYIFAFKMLHTRSPDMSNFAVTTKSEHWSKKSEKLSPFLSIVKGLDGGVWYSLFIKNLVHYSSH